MICGPFCPFAGCDTCGFKGGEPAPGTTAMPVDNSAGALSSSVATLGTMTREPATTRLDGCPECMTRDNAPRLTEDANSGVSCHYLCHVCGCKWSTSWWGV